MQTIVDSQKEKSSHFLKKDRGVIDFFDPDVPSVVKDVSAKEWRYLLPRQDGTWGEKLIFDLPKKMMGEMYLGLFLNETASTLAYDSQGFLNRAIRRIRILSNGNSMFEYSGNYLKFIIDRFIGKSKTELFSIAARVPGSATTSGQIAIPIISWWSSLLNAEMHRSTPMDFSQISDKLQIEITLRDFDSSFLQNPSAEIATIKNIRLYYEEFSVDTIEKKNSHYKSYDIIATEDTPVSDISVLNSVDIGSIRGNIALLMPVVGGLDETDLDYTSIPLRPSGLIISVDGVSISRLKDITFKGIKTIQNFTDIYGKSILQYDADLDQKESFVGGLETRDMKNIEMLIKSGGGSNPGIVACIGLVHVTWSTMNGHLKKTT